MEDGVDSSMMPFTAGKWPVPEDEESRISLLREFDILDSAAERAFDNLALLATQHFRVPIGLVSLVDSERQWFKACIGLDVRETPRSSAFCAHAILPDVTDVFGAVLSNITSQIPNRCCGALFRLCMLRQAVSAPCTYALRRHSRLAWCSDARRARHIIREIYVKVTLRR